MKVGESYHKFNFKDFSQNFGSNASEVFLLIYKELWDPEPMKLKFCKSRASTYSQLAIISKIGPLAQSSYAWASRLERSVAGITDSGILVVMYPDCDLTNISY